MSRNIASTDMWQEVDVTSRKGRVSRNFSGGALSQTENVTSRKGRVSRNEENVTAANEKYCHVP